MKFKWKYYTEKLLQFQGDAKKIFTQPYHAKMPLTKMLSLRKSELQTHLTFFSLMLLLVQN